MQLDAIPDTSWCPWQIEGQVSIVAEKPLFSIACSDIALPKKFSLRWPNNWPQLRGLIGVPPWLSQRPRHLASPANCAGLYWVLSQKTSMASLMANNDDAETKSPSFSPEDLKKDLAAELDKIGHTRKTADDKVLRKVLRRWLQNGSDASPRTLLYPVKGDPPKVGYGSKYEPYVNPERMEDGTMGMAPLHVPAMPLQAKPKRLARPVGLHTSDERGRAAVKLLRELARDEYFEVFLTQLSGARNPQEQEHTVSGLSCIDYLDVTGRLLFSSFIFPAKMFSVQPMQIVKS